MTNVSPWPEMLPMDQFPLPKHGLNRKLPTYLLGWEIPETWDGQISQLESTLRFRSHGYDKTDWFKECPSFCSPEPFCADNREFIRIGFNTETSEFMKKMIDPRRIEAAKKTMEFDEDPQWIRIWASRCGGVGPNPPIEPLVAKPVNGWPQQLPMPQLPPQKHPLQVTLPTYYLAWLAPQSWTNLGFSDIAEEFRRLGYDTAEWFLENPRISAPIHGCIDGQDMVYLGSNIESSETIKQLTDQRRIAAAKATLRVKDDPQWIRVYAHRDGQ